MDLRRLGQSQRFLPAIIAIMTCLGLSLAPRPALADCPANAYETGRTETADKIRIKCRCDLGFKFRDGQCRRYISQQLLVKSTPFMVVAKKGSVRAFIKRGGSEFRVNVKKALSATDIVTGADSHVVFQLPGGKRLAIGPNSTLQLGDKQDGFDLNINSAKGVFRLKEPKASAKFADYFRRAKSTMGYAIAWIEKSRSRRFKVRTPTTCVCVRGTDFVMIGSPNGDLTIRVIEGAVDLVPNKAASGPTVTIKAGEQGLISKGGKTRKLTKVKATEIHGQWTAQTGLKDLPVYGK